MIPATGKQRLLSVCSSLSLSRLDDDSGWWVDSLSLSNCSERWRHREEVLLRCLSTFWRSRKRQITSLLLCFFLVLVKIGGSVIRTARWGGRRTRGGGHAGGQASRGNIEPANCVKDQSQNQKETKRNTNSRTKSKNTTIQQRVLAIDKDVTASRSRHSNASLVIRYDLDRYRPSGIVSGR